MEVFLENYGDNLTEEQKQLINNQLHPEEKNKTNEKYFSHTEYRNSDDILEDPYRLNISKNRKKDTPSINEKAQKNVKISKIGKKRGRRAKKSPEDETRAHTSNSDDNKRIKNWRLFLKKIKECVNALCQKEKVKNLEPTNFIQQFGSSSVQNNDFVRQKIYKYFTFTKYKKKENHRRKSRNISEKNETIIRKMVLEKKNDVFIALMKSTIRDIYLKCIKDEKYIDINGTNTELTNFDTISDILEEKRAEFEKECLQEAEDRLKSFEEEFTSLIDFIEKNPKRKDKYNANLQYATIPELDKD